MYIIFNFILTVCQMIRVYRLRSCYVPIFRCMQLQCNIQNVITEQKTNAGFEVYQSSVNILFYGEIFKRKTVAFHLRPLVYKWLDQINGLTTVLQMGGFLRMNPLFSIANACTRLGTRQLFKVGTLVDIVWLLFGFVSFYDFPFWIHFWFC